MSDARYAEVVRWLKLAAGALAGATVALAIFNNYQASKEVVPAYEPVGTETVHRNQTIVYRQEPSPQSDVRAVQVEASVYEVDDAEPYTARAVQTVRFVNPSPREIIGASAPAPSESGGFKLAAAGLVTAIAPEPSEIRRKQTGSRRPRHRQRPGTERIRRKQIGGRGSRHRQCPRTERIGADSNWQPRASSPQ